LQFASPFLKNDFQFIVEASNLDIHSLQSLRRVDKPFFMKIPKEKRLIDLVNPDLQKDVEIVWFSKKYFKTIQSIQTFDIHFKVTMKRNFEKMINHYK
jgi:hypothetical protein